MRIENGVLYGVETSDIKDGTFVIPEGVHKISECCLNILQTKAEIVLEELILDQRDIMHRVGASYL
jgi:hypothetical protein